MGRISRNILLTDGCLTHKTWHAHNREFNLENRIDKTEYLKFLFKKISSDACSIHAYSIMSNHSHELYTVKSVKRFSDFMRIHHTLYGQSFNRRNSRKGKVANERPSTTPIKNEAHEIIATFYIHANLPKANIDIDINEYEFSTHRLYAFGIKDDFNSKIEFPGWYLNFGNSALERQKYYLFLFNEYLKNQQDFVHEIYKQTKTLACG